MRKRVSIILSLVLAFALFVPFVTLQSNSAEASGIYKAKEENGSIIYTEEVNVPSSGVAMAANTSTKNSVIEKARSTYNQSQKDHFLYTEIPTGETPNYITSSPRVATTSAGSKISLEHKLTFDEPNKQIIISTKIQSMVGKKPVIVITGNTLYGSNKYRDGYTKYKGYTVEWTGSDIKIGKTKKVTYKVNSTKFWTSKGRTTVGFLGSTPKTTSSQLASPILANKKAIMYPKIYNSHSKRYMSTPISTTMKKVPQEKRVAWGKTQRKNFIKEYEKKYGKPKFSWDGKTTEIHHTIPREYGGTNSFQNLFPLPYKTHRSVVSPWWTAY